MPAQKPMTMPIRSPINANQNATANASATITTRANTNKDTTTNAKPSMPMQTRKRRGAMKPVPTQLATAPMQRPTATVCEGIGVAAGFTTVIALPSVAVDYQ